MPNFLSIFSNPLWRVRNLYGYVGPAGAPTLWSYDANGYVSGSNGRTLSAEESAWVSNFNSERSAINQASRNAIDNIMQTIMPLSNSLYNELMGSALDELTSHVDWLTDHQNGSAFYFDGNNYAYYDVNNPDAEADYRYYRMQQLLAEAGLSVDEGEVGEKVNGGVQSPIAIDLGGDGIDTSSLFVDGGIQFDMNGDGVKDKTAWLSGSDAFLAVDKNGNGQIDGIGELFGGPNRGDGFASLATYDTNADGTVDQNDAQFSDLLLWKDANMDGVTDANELQNAAAAGLESISTDYASQEVYESGNLFGEVSTATFQGQDVAAVDIYFRYKAALSNASQGESAAPSALISAMASFSVPAAAEAPEAVTTNSLLTSGLAAAPA